MGRLWLSCIPLLVLSWSTECIAGNNARALARLSWSEEGPVTNLGTVPNMNPIPLFLRLENAPDIQQLAVSLQWTPNSIVGPCYFVVPDSSVLSCGQTRSRPPTGGFDGDSSYAWTISFANGLDKSCVKFQVEGGHCDSVAATFCLVSVRTLDSNGAFDNLEVAGGATLLGGTGDECPSELYSVQPTFCAPESALTYLIQGANLSSATWVEFQSATDTVKSTTLTVVSSRAVSTTVAFGSTPAAHYNLAVGDEEGQLALLQDAVQSQHSYSVSLTVPPGAHWCEPSTHTLNDVCQALAITCSGLLCPSVLFPDPGPTWNGTAPLEPVNAVHMPYVLHFTDNGNPLPGLPFDVFYFPYDKTGGHCHTNDLSLRAAFYQQQAATFARVDGLSDQLSDANGDFVDDKILPEVAGLLQLRVVSRDPSIDLTRTFGLFVGQWGLVDARTQGVEWDQGTQPAHPACSYVDPFIISQLKAIRLDLNTARVPAVDSADQIDDPTGNLGTALLGILTVGLSTFEDASLPWGGVLDVADANTGGGFRVPSTWHRRGLSVDIKPNMNWPLSANLVKQTLDLQLPSLKPTQAGWMRQWPRYWLHHKGMTEAVRIHLEWGNY